MAGSACAADACKACRSHKFIGHNNGGYNFRGHNCKGHNSGGRNYRGRNYIAVCGKRAVTETLVLVRCTANEQLVPCFFSVFFFGGVGWVGVGGGGYKRFSISSNVVTNSLTLLC